MKNIDLIYDIFDQAAMIYYDNLKTTYLDALSEINSNLNNDIYSNKLPKDIIDRLEFIYTPIREGKFSNEEIRLALELFTVKGLKHVNYPQNIMTPDFVNYLFSIIINELYETEITIIDTNLKTANMAGTIKNHYPNNLNLIGIEEDSLLTKYASAVMALCQNDIKIYYQDILKNVPELVELVVGDLDSHNIEKNIQLDNELYLSKVRYFPYLVISTRLANIIDDGYFIYLVDTDFFQNKQFILFNKYLLGKARISGLIILPRAIVLENHSGKCIIIGKKSSKMDNELKIMQISSIDKTSLEMSVNKIKTMIRKIKEE